MSVQLGRLAHQQMRATAGVEMSKSPVAATIRLGDGVRTLSCHVRDISAFGARVTIDGDTKVFGDFDLVMDAGGFEAACETRGRHVHRVAYRDDIFTRTTLDVTFVPMRRAATMQ